MKTSSQEKISWQLWRQDDNGIRFLVEKFPSKELAGQRLAELARGQHKQIYWICEDQDSANASGEGK